ncbi:hypothetical protein OROGR_017686 [Orobanche gracilis]
METKTRRNPAELVKNRIGFEGLFFVDGGGSGGGLALFWKDKNVARLIGFSTNFIDIEVLLPGQLPWRLTCFYGYPERARREDSWNLLRTLASKSSLPWVVIGDFNDLSSQSEKFGHHIHPNSLIEGFNQALDDCGLHDIGMKGYEFTWVKSRGTDRWVEERLDRAVSTDTWMENHSQVVVHNIQTVYSDHAALFMDLDNMQEGPREHWFRFESAWLLDKQCREVVLTTWGKEAGMGLNDKLSVCAEKLQEWGGEAVANFGRNIKRLKACLRYLRGMRDIISAEAFVETTRQLKLLQAQQDAYWRQQAKMHWLNDGDRNTKFFHRSATARMRKNHIRKLKDENGMWVEDDLLRNLVQRYYQKIFTSNVSKC